MTAPPLILFTSLLVGIAAAQLDSTCVHLVGHSPQKVIALARDTSGGTNFATFFARHHRSFQGVPYGSGGRGSRKGQTLVNVEEMDCLTFVENFLALYFTRRTVARSNTAMTDEDILAAFVRKMNHIRYYRAINCEWEDRLFYFTQAMWQLQQYDVVTDVASINGEPYRKRIHYVSSHRDKYPGIRNWAQVLRLEQELSAARRFYYPLDAYDRYREVAQPGDIIAFASTVDGLDISHVGFIDLDKDGELLITHSSSITKQLEVEQNLCQYLTRRMAIEGFFIYRVAY